MALLKIEQETIICYNEEETEAIIDSCNRALIKRLEGLSKDKPEICYLEREDQYGKRYRIPKKWIRVNPPRKSNMTEEQRQAASVRLKERHRIEKFPL